jgi:hypothetical protein
MASNANLGSQNPGRYERQTGREQGEVAQQADACGLFAIPLPTDRGVGRDLLLEQENDTQNERLPIVNRV